MGCAFGSKAYPKQQETTTMTFNEALRIEEKKLLDVTGVSLVDTYRNSVMIGPTKVYYPSDKLDYVVSSKEDLERKIWMKGRAGWSYSAQTHFKF